MTVSHWVSLLLSRLAEMSRTLGGVSDTSSSDEKPSLVMEGEDLKARTKANIARAAEYLFAARDKVFADEREVRAFVDELARLVSNGLLPVGQGLYRTWETKFRQTSPSAIEGEYSRFCERLYEGLRVDPDTEWAVVHPADDIAFAGWVERELDSRVHPFADGCGRSAKLLSSWVLLRAGLMPPRWPARAEYYRAVATMAPDEWDEYYSSFVR
jgi:fido (protein-threonine AMPylation protein)